MAIINNLLTSFFDVFFLPFSKMSPWVGLIVLSLLTGAMMLWIFKLTSNQRAIRAVKDRIHCRFLEIRLFQDDPAVIIGSLGGILRDSFVYMRYSLVPMLFMIVPVILMLVQADMRYGVRPLMPGESVLLSVKLKKASIEGMQNVKLEIPDGVKIKAGAVRMPGQGEIDWELNITAPGLHTISISTGDTKTTHEIAAVQGIPRAVKTRLSGPALDLLLNPGSPPISPASPIERIEIHYPPRKMKIAGITIHWPISFFLISTIFGFSIKSVFGIEV